MKSITAQRILASLMGILAGLLVGGIVLLGRSTVLLGSMRLTDNPYLPRFLDKAYLVIFGGIWLVSWFVMYWYLGDGVRYNILWMRAARLAGILLVALFFATAPGFYYAERGPDWLMIGLVSAGLALGAFLLAAARRMRQLPARGPAAGSPPGAA